MPVSHNMAMASCMPSLILIHPTVWPQQTNVTEERDSQTDRTDKQRSDSMANRFINGRPKMLTYKNITICEGSLATPPRVLKLKKKSGRVGVRVVNWWKRPTKCSAF